MSAMKEWEVSFVALSEREHGGPEIIGYQADAELRPGVTNRLPPRSSLGNNSRIYPRLY
jgi:hypothetical protein